MRIFRHALWVVAVATVVGISASWGQNPAPVDSSANPPAKTTATSRKHVKRPAGGTAGKVEVIPLESAPASPPAYPAAVAAQKTKDQQLLEEQKRQSDAAAQITNQQVEKAQKQQESVQNQVRIQDAPGPAQTGVVPQAGPPVAPANTDQRIQDAPGPAQTLPQPVKPPQD